MCAPKSAAHPRVSSSPKPIAKPLRLIRANPNVASATPSHTAGPIGWRSTSQPISGVNTTNIPVMNPDTVAEVCSSPNVCSTYPRPRSRPR